MTKFRPAKMTEADRAVYAAMSEYELKKGQMLLLGPQSIAILTGAFIHEGGALPDKVVYERKEWNK